MDKPNIVFSVIQVPQPGGGVLVKPGEALADDFVGTTEAARMTGMSPRWVIRHCELGTFKTAFKPGDRPRAQWRVSRAEVITFISKRRGPGG